MADKRIIATVAAYQSMADKLYVGNKYEVIAKEPGQKKGRFVITLEKV